MSHLFRNTLSVVAAGLILLAIDAPCAQPTHALVGSAVTS
jgi:hypothetical protein